MIEHFRVTSIFSSICFKWDEGKGEFEVKAPNKLLIYKIRMRTAWFYTASVLFQVALTWNQANISVKMHSILFSSAIVMNCYCHHTFYSKRTEIVAYLNGMMMFEKQRNPKQWKPNDFHGIITTVLIRLMAITGVTLPFLYHLELIRLPCMPMHLGYFLAKDICRGEFGMSYPSTWSMEEIGAKLLILGVSYFNWSFLMSGFPAHLSVGLMLKGHCLRSYILLCRKEMMGSTKVTTTNNKKSKTMIFRELQAMSISYRLIYSCYFTVVMMIAIMSVHIISLYSCLKLTKNLPVAMILFYIMSAFDCAFIILLVYGGLADVVKASISLHRDLKGKAEIQVDRWFRKFIRSCQIIKVHFGETSFIDEMTPLVFEDFVIQQTVSLLLVK
ncbi:unnamed protein product [Orchesella dallaii]|uniref:Odorant receptor n=1 Tax=Orchesella dallaii TaxID=48710 RepID=A0ABP1R7Z4_9HEXA